MQSGYVGIYNQGSTCYLNSVIQALYHLPAFRTQIFSLPATQEDSAGIALRNVFAQLEARSNNITTTEMTKAFGWSAQDAAVQHDVHELTQQLFDSLETMLKETPQKDMIRDMFGGFMIYRSRAVDGADYLSDRLEGFYDVELVVQNKSNIEESLQMLSSGERIEGVSVELTPGGPATPHTIERSQHFLDCPKVLLVHPNRVAFDTETYDLVTLRNVWSFEKELSLSSYVVDDASLKLDKESQEKWKSLRSRTHRGAEYTLRSILTHAGNATIGHYYVYVNFDGEWVRFNDEVVEAATEEDVRKSAFGGQSTQSRYRLFDNERASLLMYVNDDVKAELLRETPAPREIVELGQFIEAERTRKEETRKIAYYLCNETIVDVFDMVHGATDRLQRHLSVRVPAGQDQEAAFVSAVAAELEAAPSQIRLFFRGREGFMPWSQVDSVRNTYEPYYYPTMFVDVVPETAPAGADAAFIAFLRNVEAPDASTVPVRVVRSLEELASALPSNAVALESREGARHIAPITSATQLRSGANLIFTRQRAALDVVRDYLLRRVLVRTSVYLYDDFTASETKIDELQVEENTSYETLQALLHQRMAAAKMPVPPSPDYLAFFKSVEKVSYSYLMPLAPSFRSYGRGYLNTLRDLWGRATQQHKIVVSVLPMPLESVDLSLLVTFNGGYKNQPHVYVPRIDSDLTFRDILALAMKQLRPKLAAQLVSRYAEQLKGGAPHLRLLRVRRGELVDVIDTLDAVVEAGERDDLVLDKLSPTLVGHDVVNVLFCRRRSGERYFGLPTNICVKATLEEQGDALLRRIVKKLSYPDPEEAVKKWILCVMNVKTRKTRTASLKEVLGDLVKEVGGAPYVFVVDRPSCMHLDGAEEDDHRQEAIVIKSTSKADLSAL